MSLRTFNRRNGLDARPPDGGLAGAVPRASFVLG
jgi:hypothetical protein